MGIIDDIFTLRRQNDFRSDGVWPTTVTTPLAATTATAGWYGGGSGPTPYSTVGRITFATDTVASSTRGPLTVGAKGLTATGTLTNGWWGGGQTSDYQSAIIASVSRVTFATDTATASTRGSLPERIRQLAATTDGTTYGWFGGGYTYPYSPSPTSAVSRITYVTDTATSTYRGSLAGPVYLLAATGLSTHGYFAGGNGGGGGSSVHRITYATDSSDASLRGPLSAGRYALTASTDSSTYGWFFGGGYSSRIDRITYTTDTATATLRSNLGGNRSYISATCDNNFAWISTDPTLRLVYANDTVNPTSRGTLTSSTAMMGATSGTQ
jgi:hypothetical protein